MLGYTGGLEVLLEGFRVVENAWQWMLVDIMHCLMRYMLMCYKRQYSQAKAASLLINC